MRWFLPLMAATGVTMSLTGLQAAVRVRSGDVAASVGRFNAAFLFGGAVGSPGGLLVAGIIDGRAGYQVALVVTGALALLVAGALAAALPSLAAPTGMPPPRIGLPRFGRVPASGAALVLSVAYRLIRHVGVVTMLIASFGVGTLSAALLALSPSVTTYLVVSGLFGVSLAGATASLPVLVVAQVGDSSAGLAKFRISAGIGILIGSVGCAVLATQVGIAALFALIAVVLLGSAQLARFVGRHMAAT